MTEKELRLYLLDVAKSWIGYSEASGKYKEIIDLYNAQTPLPVGYKVKYTDEWCATYVSAVGIKAGLKDIILPECSCYRMVQLYQAAGRWMERDDYVPDIGDIIMYDWQDSGSGDNTGTPDHVGYVAEVNGNNLTILEGNRGTSVGYRYIQINGVNIRGYCLPDYASKAPEVDDMMTDEMFDEMMEHWRQRQQAKDWSDWAKDEQLEEWCKANPDIISGGDNGAYMPLDLMTREQNFAVQSRTIKRLENEIAELRKALGG